MVRKELTQLDNSEIERWIDERVHHERNRRILKRQLIDGIGFEPLAEEFKLSVTQTKRIVYKYRDEICLK
jgi:hypothetical protein